MTLYHCWFDEADETEDTDRHIVSHAHAADVGPDDATDNAGGATGKGGKGKGGKGGKGGGRTPPGANPKPKPAPKAKTAQQLARTVSR